MSVPPRTSPTLDGCSRGRGLCDELVESGHDADWRTWRTRVGNCSRVLRSFTPNSGAAPSGAGGPFADDVREPGRVSGRRDELHRSRVVVVVMSEVPGDLPHQDDRAPDDCEDHPAPGRSLQDEHGARSPRVVR
jgi:hypothetical protein